MAKNKKATDSNFAQESAATATENAPSMAMVALFGSNGNVDTSKLKRRNMPQMVKPGEVPMGGIVSGEIIDVVKSPVSTVKGFLLWLRHESGQEFTFPCTGVIRNALAPGIRGDDKESKELFEALKKEIGKTIIAKRLPNKFDGKHKKDMFMFDVFTD